ncbi:MAG: biotin--[acetyl-CoA-carboxylase] ligase [Candidatus Rokubacteria bacterium]|nr:biotin--[acetyl-CoA-carboxylase] ligase [Candidatus Rokubacteria bacterium]
MVRLGVVDSTQTVVWALAERGARDRTVVVADLQTAGRGRRGRSWDAASGTSLLASILVWPRLASRCLPTLSLATAVAVAGALARVAEVRPRLKWPNDVLVGGRKIGGILLESRIADAPVVAVGIGINLSQRRFPPSLDGRATSVVLEAGRAVDRDAVLSVVLEEFDHWRGRLERDGFAPVRERWLALADTIGRRVAVDGRCGVAVDVDGEGALVLHDGSLVHRVVAGAIASP